MVVSPTARGLMPYTNTVRNGAQGVFITIRLQPNASRSGLREVREDHLRWSVTAKAVDGAANKALIVSVSKWLGVARGNIEIISGQHSRNKKLFVVGIDAEMIQQHLEEVN